MLVTSTLIITPLIVALLVLLSKVVVRDFLTIIFVSILSLLSIYQFISFSIPFTASLSSFFHFSFVILDIFLLFYFLWQGILKKEKLVSLLAISQIVLFTVVLYIKPVSESSDIFVDKLSNLMYLIINIVGGCIIVYALKYIESEEFSRFKKNAFISMLFFFLAVMNFIVSTNNIEIFFLLFELTTLCSYILIGIRDDELSVKNALKALWMNQIGGVAILIALIFSITKCNTIYFDELILNSNGVYLLPIVFLAIAAFVKGASIPFDKWLLGAMVAPTPVSAILHSATMVKIAPYLMLKLAPAMTGFVSVTITLLGTFVFLCASILALSKDYFKEILGLSTIAFLALMMALAAMGTPEAINACMILIVFHAISKALLFLQAGVLEKSFHLKYVNDINGLINYSPLLVFFIIIGFASLTLPPFGAFIGKFMAIESIADGIKNNSLYVFSLVFIALGNVFLILLYFKVVTKLFASDIDSKQNIVTISKYYTIPSFILLIMLLIGIYEMFSMDILSNMQIVVPLILITLVPLLFMTLFFRNANRVKEYNCGEKEEIKLNMYYFDIPEKMKTVITIISILVMLILIVGVAL